MTTGEMIKILSRYPEDTVLYMTCREMVEEGDACILVTGYDPDSGTLDVDIF